MSDLSEFKDYIADLVEEKGHTLGPWHWAPFDNSPAHEAICKACDGRVHLYWNSEQLNWLADGDLVVCDCGCEYDF